jgi:hypothetical protein
MTGKDYAIFLIGEELKGYSSIAKFGAKSVRKKKKKTKSRWAGFLCRVTVQCQRFNHLSRGITPM